MLAALASPLRELAGDSVIPSFADLMSIDIARGLLVDVSRSWRHAGATVDDINVGFTLSDHGRADAVAALLRRCATEDDDRWLASISNFCYNVSIMPMDGKGERRVTGTRSGAGGAHAGRGSGTGAVWFGRTRGDGSWWRRRGGRVIAVAVVIVLGLGVGLTALVEITIPAGLRWVMGAVVTAMIMALFSPLYLPRLLNAINPNRNPVDLNVDAVQRASAVEQIPGLEVEKLGSWWAFPEEITQHDIDALNSIIGDIDDFREQERVLSSWVYQHGGADIPETKRRLTLQGVDQSVVVTGVRAKVLKREAVLEGGFLAVGLGGAESPRDIALDLDSRAPSAPFFADEVITIKPGETEVLDVIASVTNSTVTWDLIIDFVVAGRPRVATIAADSARLRTTGQAGVPRRPELPGYDLRNHYRSLAYFGDVVSYWTEYKP